MEIGIYEHMLVQTIIIFYLYDQNYIWRKQGNARWKPSDHQHVVDRPSHLSLEEK